jgi:PHD/YefM family antitoxin component YafN of YafNO toxin-antitoxin module
MMKSQPIDVRDIYSVTDFQRNAKAHVTRLRKSKTPMVLTVNGSAAVVVQDAVAYQEMADRVKELEERQRFIAAVNEGLAEAEAGQVYPAGEALEELGRKLGFVHR